jgi:hypothetical protein
VIAEPPRRSRLAWPQKEAPAPEQAEIPPHRHRSARRQWAAIVVLYLVLALNTYLVILNYQYVLGRGQYRDAEAQRIEQENTERVRIAVCDVLDHLPAGGLLDPTRTEYGCGPGIPVESLPPEAQEQLQQFASGIPEPEPAEPTPGVKATPAPSSRSAVTTAPAPTAAPPAPAPAAPPVAPRPPVQPAPTPAPAPVPAPTPAPAQPAPAPSPSPAPLVDGTPLTDTLCGLIGVCL